MVLNMEFGKKVGMARYALGMNTIAFAEMCGLSTTALSKLENQKTSPRGQTISKIERALKARGIYIVEEGVLKKDAPIVIDGEGFYERLLDDVYLTLMDKPDSEWLSLNVDDKISPSAINNRIRKIRNAGVTMRCIIEQGNTYIMGPLKEYRALPKKRYINNPILIYGEKVALCDGEFTKATIFTDRILSKQLKNIFEHLWETLPQPEKSAADERF